MTFEIDAQSQKSIEMLASPEYPFPTLAAALRHCVFYGNMQEAGAILSCFVRLGASIASVDDADYLHYTGLPLYTILVPHWQGILKITDVGGLGPFLSDEAVLMRIIHQLWLITKQVRQSGEQTQEIGLDRDVLCERVVQYVVRIAFRALDLQGPEDPRVHQLLEACADATPLSATVSTFFGLRGRK